MVLQSIYQAMFQAETSFRFTVIVDGNQMATFTECTLPTLEVETNAKIQDGGSNSTITMPVRTKTGNLTLKKGIGMTMDMYNWYNDVAEGNYVKAKRSVLVAMIGSTIVRVPIAVWILTGAMPIKWTGPTLKTSENAVAVESLELIFDSIELVKVDNL